MIKKQWGILLLASLVLLTGCGTKSEPAAEGTSVSAETSETQETKQEESVGQKPEQPGGETGEAEGLRPLHVILGSEKNAVTDQETGETKASVQYMTLGLVKAEEEKYPKLAAAFRDYNAGEKKYSQETLDELIETASLMDMENVSLFTELEGEVLRADAQAVSIYQRYSEYRGGAHGYYSYSALNFDPETGRKLEFTDVVKDSEKYFMLVDTKLQEEYGEVYDSLIKIEDYLAESEESGYGLDWSVDYEGVTVYFNPYVLGSYAAGAQVAEIYFDEAPEIFEERFLQKPESYVIPMMEERPLYLDVNKDGDRERVQVQGEPVDEWAYSWKVTAGNRAVSMNDWSYAEDSYVVYANGQYYLYLYEKTDNDYVILVCVDLKAMDFDEEKNLFANLSFESNDWNQTELGYENVSSKTAFTDPLAFDMSVHLDILGTFGGVRTYRTGPDGYPQALEEAYRLETTNVLETRREVACERVDESGNILEKTVIPEGTYLYFIRTDGEGWVDMQIVPEAETEKSGDEDYCYIYTEEPMKYQQTEPIYRIRVEKEDYIRKVNGTEESEVFYGIMYAG